MNLGFFALIVASLAAYLTARVVVAATVFDAPREALFRWLLRGESDQARFTGDTIIFLGGVVLLVGVVDRIVGNDSDNTALAWRSLIALAALLVGEFVGHRYFVHEGLGCRLCVSVWTSAAAAASLSLWGRWPIVPTVVFALAAAGLATLLSFGEDWLANVTEGIADENERRRHADLAELDEG